MSFLWLSACLIDRALYEERSAALSDDDGDGWTEESECDDTDASVFPGAEERCDGVDEDCDGTVDDGVVVPTWYPDTDGDGFGADDAEGVAGCEAPEGYADGATDCDDTSDGVHPGATETPYDGVDDDCDGVDLADTDGDGEDAAAVGGTDCDDTDPTIGATAEEGWYDDGIDNDCDGDERDQITWTPDADTPRIEGVAAGGELGRLLSLTADNDCLLATAPYTDDATGTIYALPSGGGVRAADGGGWVTGTAPGAFLSASQDVGQNGLLAASQVTDADGAGTTFVFDVGELCAGASGRADELAILEVRGEQADEWLGARVAWLADLDGDGAEELALGAPGAAGGGEARGAVHVWFGGPDASTDPSSADLSLTGPADGAQLHGVSTALEVDGSGRPWLVLTGSAAASGTAALFLVDAASAESGPVADAAAAGLVTWSTGQLLNAVTIGDTDFDGSDNIIAGTWSFGLWNVADIDGYLDEDDASGFLTFTEDGEWITAVTPAGDYDADGRADTLLLADDWPQSTQRGQLAWVPASREFGGSLDYTTMPYLASGGSTGDSFGYHALPADDFDEDGTPDIAVAAPGASGGAGAVYLVPQP